MSRPLQSAVDTRGEGGFRDAELNRMASRQERLLRVELFVVTRPAPPFIKNNRRHAEALAVRHKPSKHEDVRAGARQRGDECRGVEVNHSVGRLRPPWRRAVRTARISTMTASPLRDAGCCRSASMVVSMRRRSLSVSRPAFAAYSATASRTTKL